MKCTKTLVAATLLAACALSQPVLAKDMEPASLSSTAAALADSDLSFAFGQTAQPVQVATLSEQEMKETEGAWLPLWAGDVGGVFVGWDTYSRTGSFGQAAYGFGAGFSGGFIGALPGGGTALQVGRMIAGGLMANTPYQTPFPSSLFLPLR